jgi:hypothetical protein
VCCFSLVWALTQKRDKTITKAAESLEYCSVFERL